MFRKIFFILIGLLFLASPSFSAVYFVSSADGDDTDDGTTMDDGPGGGVGAWATLLHALEAGGLSAGDTVFIRRTHSETPGADIDPLYSGTYPSPITIMSWPRPAIPNTTITQADITNGSRIIDNVIGITPDRESHTGRFATLPDGFQYLITAVLLESGVDGMAGGAEFTVGSAATNVTQTKKGKIWAFTDDLDTTGTIQYARDSASAWVEDNNITDGDGGDAEIDASGETAVGFLIDRPYAGTTVTGVNGKFQIEADEKYVADMGTAYGFDDSGWTIKEATYDADAIDLPVIDFNDGLFQIFGDRKKQHHYYRIEFKDSTDTNGIVYYQDRYGDVAYYGCLFKQTTSSTPMVVGSMADNLIINTCILEGSGGTTVQYGIKPGSACYIQNSAIFNCGISIGNDGATNSFLRLENVNLGIEIPTTSTELTSAYSSNCFGRDVAMGGVNGYVGSGTPAYSIGKSVTKIVNFQKVLGAYKEWFTGGTLEKVAVAGVTPNEKLSTNVIEIVPITTNEQQFKDIDKKIKVWESRKTYDAGTYNVKVWIYNDSGGVLNDTTFSDDICMRCRAEAAGYGDAATEYVSTMPWIYSDEIDIAVPADADDWDYLQCDNVVVGVSGSKIYCEILVSYFDAGADPIYIDPESSNP